MGKDTTLQSKVFFIKTTGKLKKVLRHNKATKRRRETSAEHSWSVALISWILAEEFEKEFRVKIDVDKMIKMALIHDLVEVIAGDVSTWDRDRNEAEKDAAEQQAANQLFGLLTPSLREEFLLLYEEFSGMKTLEARIVKGVDRLSAAIQRISTEQGWDDVQATSGDLDKIQLPRIKFSETLLKVYEQLKKEALEKRLLMTQAVICLLEDSKGKIMVAKRSMRRLFLHGLWGFPAGMVHKGESPEDTVKRIFREDFGVDVEEPVLVTKYHHKEKQRGKLEKLIYKVRPKSKLTDIKYDKNEFDKVEFITLKKLYSKVSDEKMGYVARYLRDKYKKFGLS